MKRPVIFGMALACSLAVLGCASEQQAGNHNEGLQTMGSVAPVTTQDVTAMSKAGIGDTVIVAMITATGSRFNLSASDVIALADSGVSHNVINAMIKTGDNSKQVDQANVVNVYPLYYPYDPFWYDPFWYPWYYPTYSLGFGFRNYGFHSGFGVGHGGGRHPR